MNCLCCVSYTRCSLNLGSFFQARCMSQCTFAFCVPAMQVGDHQSLVASLRQSSYYPQFKDEVSSWEMKLSILQVTTWALEESFAVWQYLRAAAGSTFYQGWIICAFWIIREFEIYQIICRVVKQQFADFKDPPHMGPAMHLFYSVLHLRLVPH